MMGVNSEVHVPVPPYLPRASCRAPEIDRRIFFPSREEDGSALQALVATMTTDGQANGRTLSAPCIT
jgi:hypothetical protein